jgi:phosphohistidine phosphatase
MDLILWRHAEAELLGDGKGDMQRSLTPKGERQARRMAEWLNRRLPEATRILVSPAMRTQQTAQALERHFKTSALLSPGCGADELLKAAQWPRSGETVLIVGHQPTLGIVASRLLAGVDQAWSVKKGAVWWLARRDREGAAQVTLQYVQAPDKV